MSIDRYAVMGNPIRHSRSPQIHKSFALQTDQEMTYTAIQVPDDGFREAVDNFCAEGGQGLNVTVPFKLEAFDLVNKRSERAERAGAVNTIVLRSDGSLFGDNTDGVGLVRDITHNHDGRLTGKRVLIVGAGGAVRGVLGPILNEKPALVVITNRTYDKAHALAEEFQDLGRVEAVALSRLEGPFHWIINGTSASLAGELPELPPDIIGPHTCAYDMMYGKEPTVFNRWALEQGAEKAFDGLGMLVEQAAESFRLWRGVMPATAPVLLELRAAL